ncbi:hypothetical protein KEK14_08880, partial [Enterococcus faecium]|nr:hypothetical protein [Enterococcus faecium]
MRQKCFLLLSHALIHAQSANRYKIIAKVSRTLAVKESIFYFNIGYFKINGLRYSSTKATLSI